MIVTESKEYNVVLGNEYLDQVQATIDYYGEYMSIGITDQIEYIPISCKQRIEDPNTIYLINFKDYHSNQELELELEDDNEPTAPTYTTIQVGNTFAQFEEQLIANVKIKNADNPLNPPPPDIFKLIQPEIIEIKDKKKEDQKVSIPISENKSTFIGHTLDNDQKQIITQLLYDNADIFATEFAELKKTNVVYHTINTGESYPIKQRAYRVSLVEQKHIEKEIAKMEKDGIIRKSKSL